MQAWLFISLVMAILAVGFALQNNSPTVLSFFSWTFQSSLAAVILISVAAGALASFLAAVPGTIKLKWHLRAARRRIAELEAAAARAATPGGGAGREREHVSEVGLGP